LTVACDGYARTAALLDGAATGKPAAGEFAVAAEFLAEVASQHGLAPPSSPDEEIRVLEWLGIDAIGVALGDRSWRERLGSLAGRELFVWAVIDGPFQGLAGRPGLGEALRAMSALAPARDVLAPEHERVKGQLRDAIEGGADGVVLGEDLSSSDGPLVSPRVVDERLVPLWREFSDLAGSLLTRRGRRPARFLHCDGRVDWLLDRVVAAGFDGLHSLEPVAETRLRSPYRGRCRPNPVLVDLIERYGDRLVFWGGMPLSLLERGDPARVRSFVSGLRAAARGGRFILGTTSGIVPPWVPRQALLAAYRRP